MLKTLLHIKYVNIYFLWLWQVHAQDNLCKSPTSSCEPDLTAGRQYVPLEQRGWSQHLRTLTSSFNCFVSSVKDSLKISLINIFDLDSRTWFSTNFWSQSLCSASLSLGFLRWNYLHQELEIGGDHSYRDKEKASLHHSRQRQVETIIWLWLCPSDWEITDLRYFVPTWLFDGWKSSTRLLHWRWR